MPDRGDYKLQLDKQVYGARHDRLVFDRATLKITPVGEPRELTAAEEQEILAATFRAVFG